MGPVYAKILGSKYADFTIISIFRTKLGTVTHSYSFSRLLLLEYGVVLKRTECFVFGFSCGDYALSPRIRLASCMSLGMMVTLLA